MSRCVLSKRFSCKLLAVIEVCLIGAFFNQATFNTVLAGISQNAAQANVSAQTLDGATRQAFNEVHQGFSVDEVIITDQLRTALFDRVNEITEASEREINLNLLQLRKAGKLRIKSTKRGSPANEGYRAAAEIAARQIMDSTGATTDEIIADPDLRKRLIEAAREVAALAPEYDVLKLVLNLRKARKLKPELVLRVAEWPRTIEVIELDKLTSDQLLAPELPGIYLFRTSEGYLYIGEASNLRNRLCEHLDSKSESPLSTYLSNHSSQPITVEIHSFDKDSPASKVTMRRAYESELIRSRNPKLNIRP